MTDRNKSHFTARATIGIGGERTISPRVEIFFPHVFVSIPEAKEKLPV